MLLWCKTPTPDSRWSAVAKRGPTGRAATFRILHLHAEGDFARMKLQHWMELAETALADDRQPPPEEDQSPER